MNLSKKSVCVFCSASGGLDQGYYAIARETGQVIARAGGRLVYGGSHAGMMGAVADGALEGGAEVYGVIPEFLTDKEKAHHGVTKLYITSTMHERQMKMGELADYFVILPGGLGTMAEFFEVATWRTLGILEKPILVVNYKGYWTPLLEMITKSGELGFLHKRADSMFNTVNTIEQLQDAIRVWTAKDDS